jgi:hypothetical protein
MRASIHALETVERRLAEVTALVDMQEEQAERFPREVGAWLRQLEDELEKIGIGSSEVAGLRSRLVSAARGLLPSDGVSRRRVTQATAATVLEQAQRHASLQLVPIAERRREAESMATRLIAVARAKGMIDQIDGRPRDEALRLVLGQLRADPDTANGAVHLEGLLGPFDVLIVLDRALPELR